MFMLTEYSERRTQCQLDLFLRVEGFDATSAEAMLALSHSMDLPLGGCFIATLILDDGLFTKQTQGQLSKVSELKLKVFEAFKSAFRIETLDFFVSLSSMMAVCGYAGQFNYVSSVWKCICSLFFSMTILS